MPLKTESLASMCEAVIDCPHSTPVWTESGYVVLRNQNIKDGRLDLSEPSFTDEEHFKQRIRRMAPRPGDIVVTREAPMGEVCKIPEGLTCCLGQRQVLLRPKVDVDADYLLYALQSPFVQKQVRWNEGTGSTVSNIRIPVLEKIEIPRHDQAETSIAKVLGSLDSKIDLNRRINQTLEAMAQAIFKSWFVDFDPVKAKIAAIEQGEDPLRGAMRAISGKTDAQLDQMPREHHDQLAATAALFPDAMEESELGEIPKGWEVGAFKQCCLRVESGGTPSRKEPVFWDGSIPWLTSGEVRDVVVLDTKEKITPDGLDSSSAKLWPPMTTVVAMYGATAGQVCLLAKEMTANQACCALIPLAEFKAFIFIAARQSIQQLSEKASGSAQQNLNKSLVENHVYVIPTKNIAEKFEKATTTLLQRWIQNQKEIATLGMVRDTLLPKLLSGELRVPDTEFIAEEIWP